MHQIILQRVVTKKGYRWVAAILLLAIVMVLSQSPAKSASASTESVMERYILLGYSQQELYLRLRAYFRQSSTIVSKDPEGMALACSVSSKPLLLAPMARRESGGNPDSKGDDGLSYGAFQVQEQHWGKVPKTPVGQALQSDHVLNMLSAELGSLSKGVVGYNGVGERAQTYGKEVRRDALALALGIE